MDYDIPTVKSIVRRYGEVWFVLDSGEEYGVHGLEGNAQFNEPEDGMVHVEGMRDGEYIEAEFHVDTIEHHYTHREV